MADKPTKRQKIEAFQAFFDAPTLAQKKEVLRQYQDVLLYKYGFWDEDISSVAMELLQRQGGDMEAATRYGSHMNFIDDVRKKGIEQAFREAEQNPQRLHYLTGAPDEQGTVLAGVIFMEDRNRPHPLIENGEVVELVAYPGLLEVRKGRGKEELVSIPWSNITNVFSSSQSKGAALTFGAEWVNAVLPVAGYSHDGVVVKYMDTLFHSELQMFFRVRGEKNAQKLTKQLVQRLYEYRRKTGDAGGPR